MNKYSGFTKINVGGKDRPFYYGVMAAELYCEWKETKLKSKGEPREVEYSEFSEDMKKAFTAGVFNPFKATDIIYACLVAGCEYSTVILGEKEEIDFTNKHVKFWIQTMPAEAWSEAGKAIAGANVNPNDTASQQEGQTITTAESL